MGFISAEIQSLKIAGAALFINQFQGVANELHQIFSSIVGIWG